MNSSSYKVIFSRKHNALVAVSEHVTANGKGAGGATRLAPPNTGAGCTQGGMVSPLRRAIVGMGLVGIGSVYMGPTHVRAASDTLPTGGVVSSGTASISTGGNTMLITQGSERASINWSSFNVGSAASVNIVQPGASSVLLNRVVGNDPSQIMGSITANGQVMLVNPNGVVFGKGGSVTATSFTASTLGISDADFQAGNYRFTRNGSTAGVLNQGTITATGGYVALLGASVSNEGKIVTKGGDVVMAAGESATISIPVSRGGKVRLVMTAADINTAVANTADGIVQTEGGQVLMQAASVGDAIAGIRHSGQIDTTGAQGGDVTLRADHGNITVNGSITANSTNATGTTTPAGGSIVIGRADDESGNMVLASMTDVSGATLESKGGFVETSGEQLKTGNVSVNAKNWLLDPYDIEITDAATLTTGYTSQVKASVINAALNNGTSVTVQTTAPPISTGVTATTTGTSGGTGNILVSTSISKTSGAGNATLTLTADNAIAIDNTITASGTGIGELNVVMTANGNAADTTKNGGIFFRSTINTNGNVTLTGTNKGSVVDATQHGVRTGGITAKSISIKGYSTRAAGSGIGSRISGNLIATGGDINVYGEGATQAGVYIANGTAITLSATGNVNVSGVTTTSNVNFGVVSDSATVSAQTINIKNDAATTATAVTGTLRKNINLLNTNTFSTTGSTGTTIVGLTGTGVGGDGVNLGNVNSSGALNISGTASDTGSSGVVLVSGATITATGSNSAISINGTINNANSGGTAVNISGAVKGVNGAAVTVTGTTNGTGMAVFTPQDTTAVGSSPGNIGNIGGATAGTVTISGTITNAASTANAVNLKGITSSANTIRITGTTAGSGAGVALLSDAAWAATRTSWTRTWSDSTWTASGLAGTNTISINGTATGTSGTGVLVAGQNVTNANGNTSVVGNGMGGGVSVVGTSYTSGSTTGTNTALLTAKSLGTQTVTVTGNLTGNTVGAGVTFGANSGVDANSMAVQGSTTAATNTATNYGVRLQGSFTTTQNSTVTGTSTSSDLSGATGLGSGVQFGGATAITTAGGTALTVKGTSTNGAGVEVGSSIVSGTGDAGTLALDGTTLYSGGSGNIGAAGVKFSANIATKNLAVTGLGYSGSGNASSLGIYIAGAVLGSQTASDTITLTGTSNNNAGSYAYYGTVQAKGNIVINGSGAGSTSGTSLEGVNKVISASGSVNITGTTPGQVDGIALGVGSSVTAASGAGVTLTSNGGGIAATGSTITNGTGGSTGNSTGGIVIRLANNSASSSSTVNFGNASIMQYGNGGINVSSDYGDITVKTIANSGTGNVVLAAGTKVAAGVGTGGNVALASGGTLSNNGGLYIYTGSYNSFGSIASQWNGLTKTGSGFGTLYYNGSSNPRNVGFNSAWSNTNTALANGDTNQVVFRENKTPAAFNIALNSTQASYGTEAYPTSQTAELTRLKNAWTGSSTLTQTDGANTFSLASADVLAGLSAIRTLGSQSAGGYENANTGGYAYSASINSGLGLNTTISNSASLVHVINKANATVTANSASATYNGTTQSVTGFTATGLAVGEIASVLTGVTASGSGKNAGTWVSTASGSDSNYNLSFQSGSLVIGKASATVTANSASAIYNGTTQSVTGFTASGLVAGEDASVLAGVSASGASGKNANTYINTATGTDSNYNLTFQSGSLVIGKANATVTANSASAIYDGTTQSVTGFTASGLVAGEDASVLAGVSAGGASGKNANTYINTATGTDSNYNLTFQSGSLVIGKASATVTANSASAIYDGTTQSVTGFTASGLAGGEDASVLTGVAVLGIGKNAGTWVSTASGSDSNYNLTFQSGSLVIGKASATVTANSTSTSYNGTTQSVTGFTASGLVAGEDASVLTGVSAIGTGKNAGTWVSTASGSDSNYNLTFQSGSLVIGKASATVTVTANSASAIYNGTTQSVTGFTASGLVAGEDASVLTGVAALGSGKNAGTWVSTASGSDSNYNLNFQSGSLVIGKAIATVTANSATATYNGTTQSVTGFTASNLAGGEDASVLAGVSASGASGKNANTYVNTATGTDSNYNLIFQSGSLVIGKASATVTANSASVIYNGATQSVTGFTAFGLVAGEDASVLNGVRATGSGRYKGTYTTSASGSDGNYNLVFIDGSLTISVVPPPARPAATPDADAITSLCTQTFGGTNVKEAPMPRMAGAMVGGGGQASYSIPLVTGNNGITTTRRIAGNPSRNNQSTAPNQAAGSANTGAPSGGIGYHGGSVDYQSTKLSRCQS